MFIGYENLFLAVKVSIVLDTIDLIYNIHQNQYSGLSCKPLSVNFSLNGNSTVVVLCYTA